MAAIDRAAGEFANNTLATITIGADTHEEWYTTVSDTGTSRSQTLLRDLGGGSDVVTSSAGSGTLTLGAIVGATDTDPYKVLDGYHASNTSFTATVAVTNGAFTGTWTYSNCQVLTVPGPSLDASGSAALIADVAIGYASRTVAFT